MNFCFHRRHLKAKHPVNYKQYLSLSDMQINSTRFLVWNFACFPRQDSNYSKMCRSTAFYFTVTLCIATNSVFIYYTRHAKYFTYLCLSLLVHCLGLGLSLERHCLGLEPQCLGLGLGLGLEPHCLGLGLGPYCLASITVCRWPHSSELSNLGLI